MKTKTIILSSCCKAKIKKDKIMDYPIVHSIFFCPKCGSEVYHDGRVKE